MPVVKHVEAYMIFRSIFFSWWSYPCWLQPNTAVYSRSLRSSCGIFVRYNNLQLFVLMMMSCLADRHVNVLQALYKPLTWISSNIKSLTETLGNVPANGSAENTSVKRITKNCISGTNCPLHQCALFFFGINYTLHQCTLPAHSSLMKGKMVPEVWYS